MMNRFIGRLMLPLLILTIAVTACGHGKKKTKADDKQEHKPGDGHDHDEKHNPGDGHDHGSTGSK